MKNPEELASEYAKVTASDIPGRERTIGENPCLKRAFIAGYKAAQVELSQTISELEAQIDNLERVHGDRRE